MVTRNRTDGDMRGESNNTTPASTPVRATPAPAAAAARLAKSVDNTSRNRGNTKLATVIDTEFLSSDGWLYASMTGQTIKVVAQTAESISVGDKIFVRQMTNDKGSWWVYDGFGGTSSGTSTPSINVGSVPPHAHAHSTLTGVGSDDHHTASHNLNGAEHQGNLIDTKVSLTTGNVGSHVSLDEHVQDHEIHGAPYGAANEVPSGSINSANTMFSTANGFVQGGLRVYYKAVGGTGYERLEITGDYSEDNDGHGFTMVWAPPTGSELLVDYTFDSAATPILTHAYSHMNGNDQLFWDDIAFRSATATGTITQYIQGIISEFNTAQIHSLTPVDGGLHQASALSPEWVSASGSVGEYDTTVNDHLLNETVHAIPGSLAFDSFSPLKVEPIVWQVYTVAMPNPPYTLLTGVNTGSGSLYFDEDTLYTDICEDRNEDYNHIAIEFNSYTEDQSLRRTSARGFTYANDSRWQYHVNPGSAMFGNRLVSLNKTFNDAYYEIKPANEVDPVTYYLFVCMNASGEIVHIEGEHTASPPGGGDIYPQSTPEIPMDVLPLAKIWVRWNCYDYSETPPTPAYIRTAFITDCRPFLSVTSATGFSFPDTPEQIDYSIYQYPTNIDPTSQTQVDPTDTPLNLDEDVRQTRTVLQRIITSVDSWVAPLTHTIQEIIERLWNLSDDMISLTPANLGNNATLAQHVVDATIHGAAMTDAQTLDGNLPSYFATASSVANKSDTTHLHDDRYSLLSHGHPELMPETNELVSHKIVEHTDVAGGAPQDGEVLAFDSTLQKFVPRLFSTTISATGSGVSPGNDDLNAVIITRKPIITRTKLYSYEVVIDGETIDVSNLGAYDYDAIEVHMSLRGTSPGSPMLLVGPSTTMVGPSGCTTIMQITDRTGNRFERNVSLDNQWQLGYVAGSDAPAGQFATIEIVIDNINNLNRHEMIHAHSFVPGISAYTWELVDTNATGPLVCDAVIHGSYLTGDRFGFKSEVGPGFASGSIVEIYGVKEESVVTNVETMAGAPNLGAYIKLDEKIAVDDGEIWGYDFENISPDYDELIIDCVLQTTNDSVASEPIYMQIGGYQPIYDYNTNGGGITTGQTDAIVGNALSHLQANTGMATHFQIRFPNYSNTDFFKTFTSECFDASTLTTDVVNGRIRTTQPIVEIDIYSEGASLVRGSRLTLYGIAKNSQYKAAQGPVRWMPDVPPVVSNNYDEEFDGSNFGVLTDVWTKLDVTQEAACGTYGSLFSNSFGLLECYHVLATHRWSGYYRDLELTHQDHVTTKVYLNREVLSPSVSTYFDAGLIVGSGLNGSSGNTRISVTLTLQKYNSQTYVVLSSWCGLNTLYAEHVKVAISNVDSVYLRLYSETVLRAAYSYDGMTWIALSGYCFPYDIINGNPVMFADDYGDINGYGDMHYAGFCIKQKSATAATSLSSVYFDFFRFKENGSLFDLVEGRAIALGGISYIEDVDCLRREDHTAECNGLRTDFNLAYQLKAGTVMAYFNGLALRPNIGFTEDSVNNVVHLMTTPATTDELLITYVGR